MKLEHADIVIGFDTEFLVGDPNAYDAEFMSEDPEKTIARGNKVLCISYALYFPATGVRLSGLVNIPPERRMRWTMKQFLEKVVIAAAQAGHITEERLRAADARHPKKKLKQLRLVLACHFSRADICGFADFRRLKRKFSAVRKTYVTIQNPHKLDLRPTPNRALTASITLRDTRLLTPEGYGKLSAIGDMLGLGKLSVPDVVNEKGKTVPGITRMDIVQREHPQQFYDYAVRDAELALLYLLKVCDLAEEMGAPSVPSTIGSLGVNVFADNCTDFEGFMGRVPDEDGNGRKLVLHPVLRIHAGLWGDGFHGGRNEAFAHGVMTPRPGRMWLDIDVASAYTVGMGWIRPIDWDIASMPTRIEDVATDKAATVARVKFRFPDNTRFPCLPVKHGAGLVFPLSGVATTTGLELLAALEMGAELQIETAIRFEFAGGLNEYAAFTNIITDYRARYKKTNPLFEKLVKTAGNALYGKTAQAVAGMRATDPEVARLFDTISGERKELPASAVTNPAHAALTTSFLRAAVSQILHNLPADARVLSVTTDGFLADCTLEEAFEAAGRGSITRLFNRTLTAVAPGKQLLEVKHQAAKVVVARTRGAFTADAREDGKEPILARAGHKIEDFSGTAWEEAAEFIRIFHARTPDTKLAGSDFISVEKQWMADADLVRLPAPKRVNLDYDFGGVPVGVTEVDGVLNFTTRPWPNVKAYAKARRAHAQLRDGGHLKTLMDWESIRQQVETAAGLKVEGDRLRDLEAERVRLATEMCGKGKSMSHADGAAAISARGLPTTAAQMRNIAKKCRMRGAPRKVERPRRKPSK
jgi:hypothetical protein